MLLVRVQSSPSTPYSLPCTNLCIGLRFLGVQCAHYLKLTASLRSFLWVFNNFLESGNALKHLISNRHSLPPPSDPLPQCLRFNILILAVYKSIYLLTYLLSYMSQKFSSGDPGIFRHCIFFIVRSLFVVNIHCQQCRFGAYYSSLWCHWFSIFIEAFSQ